jgi:hypothetical protein
MESSCSEDANIVFVNGIKFVPNDGVRFKDIE